MTTSIDVLAYLHARYQTTGRLQRQKLLYFSQAWHLAWFGTPLFSDPVTAWENGPVVRSAWRVDKTWAENPIQGFNLTQDEQNTIDAIMAFYGHMNGSQLRDLTHAEGPWVKNYVEVSSFVKGSMVIEMSEMRNYCTELTLSGDNVPQRPASMPETIDEAMFHSILGTELNRWSKTLELLADR